MEKLEKQNKEWAKNNLEKISEYAKRTYKKHKTKHLARDYAHRKKQRRPYCLLHLLENQYIPAIHFHHTDYEANLGFLVCRKHHTKVDKW